MGTETKRLALHLPSPLAGLDLAGGRARAGQDLRSYWQGREGQGLGRVGQGLGVTNGFTVPRAMNYEVISLLYCG